jgi:two-component system, OmpR family, sensor kinase
MIKSARVRLTMWHVGIVALLLITFCLGLYVVLRKNFYARADNVLTSVDAATVAMLGDQLSESGLDELAARDAVKTLNFPEYTLAIFDSQGDLLAEKPVGSSERVPLPDAPHLRSDQVYLYTIKANGSSSDLRRAAALRVTLEPSGRSYVVIASRSLTPLLGELATDRRILSLAVPGGLFLAGLAAWFLVRLTLLPVAAMSEQARRISAENLDQRLPVAKVNDEFSQLAGTLNDLLSRLSASFNLQRQFVADASHELRTPLSVIRTASAVTLQKAERCEQDYRDALIVIDEQARRLTHMVDDMFRLARADAGGMVLEFSTFYLEELLQEAVRAVYVLAHSKQISIETDLAEESLCHGDADLLRQMFINLLDNAVKYTPHGGKIIARLARETTRYVVTIEDTGIGIARENHTKVFERFFRVDPGHLRPDATPRTSGAGLGLSISRTIAEAHSGSLILAESTVRGSIFVASLATHSQRQGG